MTDRPISTIACWGRGFVLAAIAGALALPSVGIAQMRRTELAPVREAMEQGRVRPLGQIIAEIRSSAAYREMKFLGVVDLDPIAMRYKLKFLDGNQVVYVYADARSGRILGTSR